MTGTERSWRRLTEIPEERPWLSERLLRRLVAERRIPYAKVGGRVLIDLGDLDAYIEDQVIEPPQSERRPRRRSAGD